MSESPTEVIISSAFRTPVCKARRGALKDVYSDELLSTTFNAILKDTAIDPTIIDDICVGNVLQPGAAATISRMAQFYSNIPETTPIHTVNRQCSSGLQAIMNIANSIKAGNIHIGIGAGVESMSHFDMGAASRNPEAFKLNPKCFENEKSRDCLIPMGITSETVAQRFGVTREDQDEFALRSHQKAARAQSLGYYDNEIVPVVLEPRDDASSSSSKAMAAFDDGIRPLTTMPLLAKLKPAFQEGGTTTAGNSSQISDGAAACLLASRSAAQKLGLPILGIIRGFSVVGVPPDIMGIGPAVAIPHLLANASLTINDIDVFEINEAFASQALYCVRKLGIPAEKVNPNGGAIAMGHPLGCTGARMVTSLCHELRRRKKKSYGVVSMCIGTGMGAAALIEYPGPGFAGRNNHLLDGRRHSLTTAKY